MERLEAKSTPQLARALPIRPQPRWLIGVISIIGTGILSPKLSAHRLFMISRPRSTTETSMVIKLSKTHLIFFSLFSRYTANPTPTPWPEQFHSILFTNTSGSLSVVDLWYDWPNGRNFNIIQKQLGKLLYNLEWNNGTSFFYTLDSNKECRIYHFEVGILRPNWLDGANYLGQKMVDGFLCDEWEKVDFIWYYEDVVTKRPIHWDFFTGMSVHVMTFEVGAALEDAKWQAPVYCFDKENKKSEYNPNISSVISNIPLKKSLRGLMGS